MFPLTLEQIPVFEKNNIISGNMDIKSNFSVVLVYLNHKKQQYQHIRLLVIQNKYFPNDGYELDY